VTLNKKSPEKPGRFKKTALVFGYANDYAACSDMVAAWKAKYPLDTYRCTPAN